MIGWSVTSEFQLNRKNNCYATEMNRTHLNSFTKFENRKLRWNRCQRTAHSPKSSRLISTSFFHNCRNCGRTARPDLLTNRSQPEREIIEHVVIPSKETGRRFLNGSKKPQTQPLHRC